MEYLAYPFGYIMRLCYNLLSNYGLAIILFTLLTKVVMLPVSLWTHKNSVKLVKLQPELNVIKAKYYGEKDKISEEQLSLYKREKYRPLAGMLPMVIQLVLLMCVVQIIYNPLSNVLAMDKNTASALINSVCADMGLDSSSNSIQLAVVKAIQEGFTVDGTDLSAIKALDMNFLGFDLSSTPIAAGGIMLLVPVLAGGCALALCLFQNKMNPLQAEQGRAQQLATNALSVGISLVLGGFVPAGIGLYWIFSNLFTMVQQLVLNAIINPKKYIDYKALEESKKELEKIDSVGQKNKIEVGSQLYRREKADYKKFFSVANKHLVIYSERNGYYKYFSTIIDYLLNNSNIIIHYVTSDPNDNIFNLAKENSKIRPYFIGEKKLITLFMKMDADIVLMTMPDIENFHYKRSYIRKDIEYIYTMHGPMSTHLLLNNHSLDSYDTIFCIGEFQIPEIRRQEEIYNLPPKNLVMAGYGFLEILKQQYDQMPRREGGTPRVLVAPSWQEDNILDLCLDELLSSLLGKGLNIIVRPHPEYVKRYSQRLDAIVKRYSDYKGDDLKFELDFTSSDSIYQSDLLITDWSAIAFEYSYVTLKPCLFINTPMKVMNKEYKQIGIEPLEIKLRNEVGVSLEVNEAGKAYNAAQSLLEQKDSYADKILNIRNTYISNFGKNGEVAGKYIIQQLIKKQKQNKE